jgi:hypothetical protein
VGSDEGFNDEAVLVGNLPDNPLKCKVITSAINDKEGTTYTVFGSDVAVQHARSNAAQDCPAGAVISFLTWSQQEDARWFRRRA